MSRRTGIWSFALLAILVGSWSPIRLCAGGNDPGRPFWGTAVGMVTESVPPNELVIEYTGTATQLGQFTRAEYLFLNPDGSFIGKMVFTVASGDELWLDFSGAFTSPTVATGTYRFTGGTGRFRNATGAATFTAYTPDGMHVVARFVGRIRF